MITPDTLIGFALDASGSMHSQRAATVEGFNAFLAEQKAAPGSALFSLTLFDTTFQAPFVAAPLAEVPELGSPGNPYSPSGGTALLDAVGSTIRGLEAWQANHGDFTGQVICVILTDGAENSSREWKINPTATAADEKDVGQLIKAKQEQGWSFLFLGAGGSAWLERTFGHVVAPSQFTGYDHTDFGNRVAYASVSNAALRSRSSGVAASVSAEDELLAGRQVSEGWSRTTTSTSSTSRTKR